MQSPPVPLAPVPVAHVGHPEKPRSQGKRVREGRAREDEWSGQGIYTLIQQTQTGFGGWAQIIHVILWVEDMSMLELHAIGWCTFVGCGGSPSEELDREELVLF